MMNNSRHPLQIFLEAWSPEFEKSVEMFTGHAVKLDHEEGKRANKTFDSGNSVLWQGQIFEREETGTVWIGTPLETCTALTESSADDSAGRESLYREILRQSFEGAAHILSAGRTPRMVCKQAVEDKSPAAADLAGTEPVWFLGPGGEHFPILVAIQPAFAALVSEAKEDRPSETSSNPPGASREASRLGRLADLELPIAVVLGRAQVPIREVLKLTAGSLVELNRSVGEPVEIVVHNAIVARGEVVSVAGNYGIKIQEVISQRDRFALQAAANPSKRPSYRTPVN